MMRNRQQRESFNTTVGDVISAFYEAALAALGDEAVAQRVASLLAANAIRQGKLLRARLS